MRRWLKVESPLSHSLLAHINGKMRSSTACGVTHLLPLMVISARVPHIERMNMFILRLPLELTGITDDAI